MSKYVSAFEGLDELDYEYPIYVYNIVRSGGKFVKGRWRKANTFPNSFWNKENAKRLLRYFILEENKWKKEQTCNNLTLKFLKENYLSGVCKTFKSNTYVIISTCFPEWNVLPWEIKSPRSFWSNIENAKKVTLWIAKKENLLDRDSFIQNISSDLYRKYGVHKAVSENGGLFKVISYTYPERKYKAWEVAKLSKITPEIVSEATRWMIEEKLHWTYKEVCEKLTAKTFYDNGIGKILCKGANHSPIQALQIAYPGKYTKDVLHGKSPKEKRMGYKK